MPCLNSYWNFESAVLTFFSSKVGSTCMNIYKPSGLAKDRTKTESVALGVGPVPGTTAAGLSIGSGETTLYERTDVNMPSSDLMSRCSLILWALKLSKASAM